MYKSRASQVLLIAAWLCIGAGGCRKSPTTSPVSPAATSDRPAAGNGLTVTSSPAPVGMKAPFTPLDSASTKKLAAGFKALRAAKYGQARVLFHEVVAARPDYTPARFQELRAAALADPAADVREQWRDLLMRDFVGYAGRLETQKDLAPLRGSAQGAELARIQAMVRKAYAEGLDRGFFFVARSKRAKPPLYDEHGTPILDLNQEAYHLDPASGLVRRLSDSGGRVAGIWVDRARKQLLMLLVNDLTPSEEDSGLSFSALSAAASSLDTLDSAGPVPLPIVAPLSKVTICTSSKGEGLWVTDVSRTFDAAKKAMVPVPAGCAPGSGVRVTPYRAVRLRPRPETSVDQSGVITVGADGGTPPIRISRPQGLDSIEWSPNRTRLVYAGNMDPCSLEMAGWPRTGMNELYVWDAGAGKATRLAAAFSFFGWEWLDDDHLVYETASKKIGKVAVHDFRAQTDTVVDTRAGAGLNAAPTLACVDKTVEDEEPEDPDDPEN